MVRLEQGLRKDLLLGKTCGPPVGHTSCFMKLDKCIDISMQDCTLWPFLQAAMPDFYVHQVLSGKLEEVRRSVNPHYTPETFMQKVCDSADSVTRTRGPQPQTTYAAIPRSENYNLCVEMYRPHCLKGYQHGYPDDMNLYFVRGSESYVRGLYEDVNGAQFDLWAADDKNAPPQTAWIDCIDKELKEYDHKLKTRRKNGPRLEVPDLAAKCGLKHAPLSNGWNEPTEKRCALAGDYVHDKECRGLWHGCVSRAVISLTRCSTCCCEKV